MDNPITTYLDELKAQRDHDMGAFNVPREPSWSRDPFAGYHLQRGPTKLEPLGESLQLHQVRDVLVNRILDYALSENDDRALLLKVPPGVGKTTASVQAAQQYALEYGGKKRILYVSSRKNFFQELMVLPGIKPHMWYNWLPIQAGDDEHPETCRYADELHAWMKRGYKGIDFCKKFCIDDGWIEQCPYRAQAKRPEPIIFGRHTHMITGMSIKDYELGFVDEMPLSSFMDKRRIPADEILVPGATGPLGELFMHLDSVAKGFEKYVYGPQLMRYIGDTLTKVYQEIDVIEDYLPIAPDIYQPEQAYDVPYWYIFDLLKKLSPEYECWRKEWSNWLGRVRLNKSGLYMLGRKEARSEWTGADDDTPRKLVFLDATGSPEMYRRLFRRPVIIEQPNIERLGKVYQIVGRLNGFMRSYKKEGKELEIKKHGKEMLETAKLIGEQYTGRVGVVTFKALEGLFAEHFGTMNTLHFGALRGSNLLETCECLIVAGGYSPNMLGVMDICKMLNPDRQKSFVKISDKGKYLNPWFGRMHEYQMNNTNGHAPYRMVSGYWDDEDLDTVQEEYRRNELTQAIYRNRPIENEHDVWILTSIPSDVPLDGIFEDIAELPFTPKREKIQTKKRTPMYKGIAGEKWLKLKPFLDQQWERCEHITVDDLAAAVGMTSKSVRTQRWRYYIDKFFKEYDSDRPWMLEAIKINPTDRQPNPVLVPVRE